MVILTLIWVVFVKYRVIIECSPLKDVAVTVNNVLSRMGNPQVNGNVKPLISRITPHLITLFCLLISPSAFFTMSPEQLLQVGTFLPESYSLSGMEMFDYLVS